MTFVDPTATSTGAAASAATSSSSSPTGLNQLDNSQTFLNLLVAQLKNQNPDNPTDPTSFMTEIAQLTAVQSQTTLNADEETVAADSMLGRQISGNGAGGAIVSGTVSGVLLGTSGQPVLELAGNAGSLNLSAVQAVYGAANSSSGTSTGSSTTTTTTTPTSTSTTPVA